jgi:hypothetical protein
VHRNRRALGQALGERVALDHARQGEAAHQRKHLAQPELVEPLGLPANLGPRRVHDQVELGKVRLGVGMHLVAGEHRPGDVLLGRVPDLGRRVPHHQHGNVTEILERPEPLEDDGMTKVQVGAGGIDPELDPKRSAAAEHRPQRIGLHHLGDPAGEDDVDRRVTIHGSDGTRPVRPWAPSGPLC